LSAIVELVDYKVAKRPGVKTGVFDDGLDDDGDVATKEIMTHEKMSRPTKKIMEKKLTGKYDLVEKI